MQNNIPKVKTCLYCGLEHSHHNDFCSSECCKIYKLRDRLDRAMRKINSTIDLKEVYRDNGITFTETGKS